MKIFDLNNKAQYPGASAPFYEAYFLKLHLIEEGLAFWFRYTLHFNKEGERHASLWAFAFDAKNPSHDQGSLVNYSLNSVKQHLNPFAFDLGEYSLSNHACSGSVQEASCSLQWDLQFTGMENSLELFPYAWMYRTKIFPKTKYVTTRPSIFFSGKIKWNGKDYFVKNAPGMQSHLWGTQHSQSFLWAHSNIFAEDSEAVFELVSPRVYVGPYLTPPFHFFYIKMFGKEYCLNSPGVWFQKDILRDLTEWNFDLKQGNHRFIGAIGANPEQFLGVRYSDPTGAYRYCNHAEWAMASIEHYEMKKGRWCLEGTVSSKATTYEWLDSSPHPSVEVKVLG